MTRTPRPGPVAAAGVSEDEGVHDVGDLKWSRDVGQAAWIAARLSAFDADVVTSIVPGGFEAYTRVLHPVETPRDGHGRTVRWAEVAAWSGSPLVPGTQFHEIALPQHRPEAPPPWRSQGPQDGTLSAADTAELVKVLAGHTATPDRCWFCLWDGYGWDNVALVTAIGQDRADSVVGTRATLPDPVPASARAGPLVRLPNREYLLCTGPIGEALAFAEPHGQTPNLWWPADKAWCVASEIDLPWTYVGGSGDLASHLADDPRIEAQPASMDEGHFRRVDGWLAQMIDDALGRLLDTGEVTLGTSRGTVRARLQPPGQGRGGFLRIDYAGREGAAGSSSARLDRRDRSQRREQVRFFLAGAIIDGLVRT